MKDIFEDMMDSRRIQKTAKRTRDAGGLFSQVEDLLTQGDNGGRYDLPQL